MDSKRRSVSDLPHDHSSKRTKTHHLGDYSNGSSFQRRSMEEEDIQPRLVLLKDLVGEMIDSAEIIRSHAGSDVTRAITELNKAFHRARTFVSSSTISAEGAAVKPLGILGGKDESCLPVLPPILDATMEKAVFTHPGVSNSVRATYDRLEILGDAYIELMATKLIWNKFQELPSGRISQIRELLVKNETLSEYATIYGLDRRASVPLDYLNQPKRWTKTKGDIFEAYVAAVILSNPADGYDLAEQWLTQLWLPKLSELGIQRSSLNAKETLAKKIMGKGVKLRYVDEHPPVQLGRGMQTFSIGVYLTGWGWNNKHLGSGQGHNKAIAGDEAARQAMLNKSLIDEIVSIKRAKESVGGRLEE